MHERLRRIAAKLALVPGLTGRAHSFGEEAHRFRLGRPLPEARVREFETRHGIRLPEGYRGFLTTLGHAGAGPHYGLLPLEDWDLAVLDAVRPGHLRTPFPLSPTGPVPGPDGYDAWGDPDAEPFPGAIALTSQGCSGYTLLVVSGPARGRLVNADIDLRPPFFCHDSGFLAWYERWLDEVSAGMSTAGFDLSLPSGPPAPACVLRDAPDPVQRHAAAWTLGRHPALTPAARSDLRAAAVGDAVAEVRRAAVIALGRRPVPADDPTFLRALTDTSEDVRATALSTLARRGGAWHARARALLCDTSPEVRRTAAHVLHDSGAITEADLTPMLSDPDRPVREKAGWILRQLAGGPSADA
ncbi:HEAT repeat domain-containing protein [Streptomyces sp. NPDC048650]|uniref:HEAT repeat domain-containing protein n=1 Tax=Streptomyces sp. NPDC048650 TaxID=3365583 RepID=UPI00371A58B1